MNLNERALERLIEDIHSSALERQVQADADESDSTSRHARLMAWPGIREEELRLEEDCSGFLGLTHNVVRVHLDAGVLHIKIVPLKDEACRLHIVGALFKLLDQCDPEWDWVLDLSEVADADLHLLNFLLSLGRQLQAQGSRFIVEELDVSSIPAVLRRVFLKQCAELGFTVRVRRSPEDADRP